MHGPLNVKKEKNLYFKSLYRNKVLEHSSFPVPQLGEYKLTLHFLETG